MDLKKKKINSRPVSYLGFRPEDNLCHNSYDRGRAAHEPLYLPVEWGDTESPEAVEVVSCQVTHLSLVYVWQWGRLTEACLLLQSSAEISTVGPVEPAPWACAQRNSRHKLVEWWGNWRHDVFIRCHRCVLLFGWVQLDNFWAVTNRRDARNL